MSVTAEQVRKRLAEARRAPSAEAVRARLAAAERASRVGTQSMGAPGPSERTIGERIKSGAAGIVEPYAQLVEGFGELTGAAPETQAAVRRGREAIQEEAAKSPGRTAANIVGDVSMMGFPASRAYRAGQMMRGLPGVRSRMAQAAAPLAAETATVAGIEAAKSPEATGRTRGEAARDVALGNVAGAGLQRAVRGAFLPGSFRRSPIAEAEAQALREAGIAPRIPLSAKGVEGTGPFSSFASWMHRRPLGSIPPTQAVIKGQQEAALSDWRDMMFQQAVPPGADIKPISARTRSLKPIRETFQDIDDWYSREYKEVLDPYNFPVQGERAVVGDAIDQAVSEVPGEASRREVQEKVGELLADMTDQAGRLTGGKVSQFKKSLRRQAARVNVDPEVAAGYQDVIEAVDGAVETYVRGFNPEHAERLAALRQPYRNRLALEEAAKGRQGGEFRPEDLLRASERKLTQERRPSARAAGRGPLQWEAERAAQTYDFPTGGEESNIFQLQALGGTMVAGAPSFLGPAGVAVTGALATPTTLGLTQGGTRFLSNEARWQRYLQDLLQREGMQELSRAVRLGGAQYAAD